MSQVSEEDKLHFAQAMKGVKPLKTPPIHQSSPPKPKVKRSYESKVTYEVPSYDYTDEVSAFESLMFYQKGLRMQDLARLRKGDFTIEGRLDLHGYTEALAKDKLTHFIQQSQGFQKRFVLVVHGKGYNSDTQAPVLKNLTNRLLRALPNVLAFCSATPKDGGVGAVYVWLKGIGQNAKRED